MAHKVLADRRDPGNKPKPGDRIRFVFVETPKKKLQGDRIETPEYIHFNNNQLMKPIQQVIELVLDTGIQNYLRGRRVTKGGTERYDKKRETLRYKEVSRLLFDEFC